MADEWRVEVELREASDRLGVTRERVRQLEKTALKHLRRILRSHSPP